MGATSGKLSAMPTQTGHDSRQPAFSGVGPVWASRGS